MFLPSFLSCYFLSFSSSSGLVENVQYDFKVLSGNSTVKGDFSPIQNITTHQTLGNVILWKSQSDTVIDIAWIDPYFADESRAASEYRVTLELSEEEGLIYDEIVDADTYPLTVKISDPSLVAGVPYTVTVQARSSVGHGEAAQITDFTRELIPPAPTGVTAERISNSHLLVSWNPLSLEMARGHVLNYIVHYQPTLEATGPRMTVMVCSTGSSVLISGLDPSVMYSVTLSASTGGGVGISSDTIDTLLPPSVANVNTTVVVGLVMVGVLLVVIGLSTSIIIWLVLRLRHHTTPPPRIENDQYVEMRCDPRVIQVEECAAYGSHSDGQQHNADYEHEDPDTILQVPPVGTGGEGRRGVGTGSEPAYEMEVAATTEEAVYETLP